MNEMKLATPSAAGPAPGQYASRVPTLAQQPQMERPVIPGLPGQRPPLGALVGKGTGAAASGGPGTAMQRGLIDSINLKQGGIHGIPFVKQKASFGTHLTSELRRANEQRGTSGAAIYLPI